MAARPTEEITTRTAALAVALDGFTLVEMMPDGSWRARFAPIHFDALVAVGGVVDRYVFGDDIGWSEVELEQQVGDVRVVLYCEKIDTPKAVS